MARPRKAIPDLYWYTRSGQWAVNLHGKRHLLGKDRAAADLRRLDLVRNPTPADGVAAAGKIPPAAAARTVREALAEYLARLRPTLHPTHLARVRQAVTFLCDRCGDLAADDLSSLHLLDLRGSLVASGRYARGHINALVRVLKTAWRWCVENALVRGEAARSVLTVRALEAGDGGRETPPRLPVDDDTVAKTVPHLPPLLRAAVRLLQITGMRPGELLQMRRCEVSTSEAEAVEPLPGWRVTAKVVGGRTVWLYAPSRHKTKRKGKVRIVALGAACQAVLGPLLEGLAPEDFVFSPARGVAMRFAELAENRKSKETPSQEERRAERAARGRQRAPGAGAYTAEAVGATLRRACQRAGVTPWTLYQLRHSLAVAVAELHGDGVAGEVLGHGEGSSATGRYTRARLGRIMGLAAQEEVEGEADGASQ